MKLRYETFVSTQYFDIQQNYFSDLYPTKILDLSAKFRSFHASFT